MMQVSFTVNGSPKIIDDVWEGETLLHLLRDRVPAVDDSRAQDERDSCTVYLDDLPVCACLVAAGQVHGRSVRTATGETHCGFCTPGLITQAHDLIERNPEPSDLEIREALAGNLCRCTGYEKILDAVRVAAQRKAVA